MIKQVILDMQNQLSAGEDAGGDRDRRPAPAREKQKRTKKKSRSGCARPNSRSIRSRTTWRGLAATGGELPGDGESFTQQVADQKAQVENLNRRCGNWSRSYRGAGQGRSADRAAPPRPRVEQGRRRAPGHRGRFQSRRVRPHEAQVAHSEAVSQAKAEIAGDDMEDRLAALEKEDRLSSCWRS